jgi:hypothetical protein
MGSADFLDLIRRMLVIDQTAGVAAEGRLA